MRNLKFNLNLRQKSNKILFHDFCANTVVFKLKLTIKCKATRN